MAPGVPSSTGLPSAAPSSQPGGAVLRGAASRLKSTTPPKRNISLGVGTGQYNPRHDRYEPDRGNDFKATETCELPGRIWLDGTRSPSYPSSRRQAPLRPQRGAVGPLAGASRWFRVEGYEKRRWPPTEVALFLDIAELLFQFRNLLVGVPNGFFVNRCQRDFPVSGELKLDFCTVVQGFRHLSPHQNRCGAEAKWFQILGRDSNVKLSHWPINNRPLTRQNRSAAHVPVLSQGQYRKGPAPDGRALPPGGAVVTSPTAA